MSKGPYRFEPPEVSQTDRGELAMEASEGGKTALVCPDGDGKDSKGGVVCIDGHLLIVLNLPGDVRSIARREGMQWVPMPRCGPFTARDADDDADAIEIYRHGRLFGRLSCVGWRALLLSRLN
jgi:hypothetical protein